MDPEHLGDHVDRLFRAAWAMCGNPHDAEDLVQEMYARVLARPRFISHEDDLGYLLRALRNTYVSRMRRNGRRPTEVSLDDHPEAVERFDLRRPDLAVEVGDVFAAIALLPDDAREAIVAVDVVGMSYSEAATVLRIRETTRTSRLHRARGRVARTLSTATGAR